MDDLDNWGISSPSRARVKTPLAESVVRWVWPALTYGSSSCSSESMTIPPIQAKKLCVNVHGLYMSLSVPVAWRSVSLHECARDVLAHLFL
jgi:hypothetical protein